MSATVAAAPLRAGRRIIRNGLSDDPRSDMSAAKTFVLAAIVALLSGCLPAVTLCPLYTSEVEVFAPRLLGLWRSVKESDKASYLFEEKEGNYKLSERGVDDETGGKYLLEYDVHIVQLGQYRFIDCLLSQYGDGSKCFYTTEEVGTPFLAPLHLVGRFDIDSDTLRIRLLDEDWVEKNLPEGTWSIVGDGPQCTITNISTAELQNIVLEQADNEELFVPRAQFTFCRRGLGDEMDFVRQTFAQSRDEGNAVRDLFWADLEGGHFEAALAVAREDLKWRPTLASAHFRAGVACLMNDDLSRARREFREATRLEPKDTDSVLYRGITAFLSQNYPEAERHFRRVRHARPSDMSGVYLLALTYQHLGKSSEAESLLVPEIRRKDPLAAAVGKHLLGQASEAEVLALLEDACKSRRKEWTEDTKCRVFFYLGCAALLRGDEPKAQECLRESAGMCVVPLPEHLAAHALLAQLVAFDQP